MLRRLVFILMTAAAALLMPTRLRAQALAPIEPAVGVHTGADNQIAPYEAFGKWLGRPVTYRVVFCDMRFDWNSIAHPWFIATSEKWVKAAPSHWEVISTPLLVTKGKPDLKSVAAGEHDDAFRSLAKELVTRGIADRTIIRLGWEFNGDFMLWSAEKSPADYVAAFRRVVKVMREEAPHLKFDWCANRGWSKMNWTDAYPGDDDVDIISMDVYDNWNSGWDDILNGRPGGKEAGLKELRAFARAHHKPEAYPEWGCDTSKHGHGDSPEFIDHMADWFAAAPGQVLYQSYWDVPSGGPNAALTGEGSGRVPKAAAEFKRRFGNAK